MTLPRLYVLVAFATQIVGAQDASPLVLSDAVRDKNFYALTLLSRQNYPSLEKLSVLKREALAGARAKCKALAACYADVFALTPGEIDEIARELQASVSPRFDASLRASGVAILHDKLTPAARLDRVWRDSAQNINRIIALYAKGDKPRYPEIDSAVYEPNTPRFGGYVERMVEWLAVDTNGFDQPWSIPLRFATELLHAQHRDEAGRYEPMEVGENAAAIGRLRNLRWADYPYSSILVPGSGSDRPNVPLSPYGRLRCEIAARRFALHQAPYIIVSGGHVHPNLTPYAEAIEMKKLLMRDYHIPADAILIDPHARHTTTNLRNAARLIFRYGMPMDKAALISTDGSQSAYIEGAGFADRCRRELGYLPYTSLKRINAFDLEWRPALDSLQIDPIEPLDP